jgi:hypothetical protein
MSKGCIKVITSTIIETAVLVLLMTRKHVVEKAAGGTTDMQGRVTFISFFFFFQNEGSGLQTRKDKRQNQSHIQEHAVISIYNKSNLGKCYLLCT